MIIASMTRNKVDLICLFSENIFKSVGKNIYLNWYLCNIEFVCKTKEYSLKFLIIRHCKVLTKIFL